MVVGWHDASAAAAPVDREGHRAEPGGDAEAKFAELLLETGEAAPASLAGATARIERRRLRGILALENRLHRSSGGDWIGVAMHDLPGVAFTTKDHGGA